MRAFPSPVLSAAAFAACVAVPMGAWADPLPPAAKAEVTALLGKLTASSCEFNRNGDWHSAAEAKSHLERKLSYLEDKNLVKTAEQFIDLGATKSSMSGKPYLVRCGGAAPVESKTWLSRELAVVRAAGKGASAPATGPTTSR
ncbi:DUF5329 domain-containing protein [Roseateles chitinivorans]|uniref:DUF5329 domain-containing protein n=1 Tax=Roseateles chitinivorans TaxID=2917965 RepID=UPI003D675D21